MIKLNNDNNERIYVDLDSHRVEINDTIDPHRTSYMLLLHKGKTYKVREGWYADTRYIALHGGTLDTTNKKRSYMILAISAVLGSRGIIAMSDNKNKDTYHKFGTGAYMLTLEFSLLVQKNTVDFRALKTTHSSMNRKETTAFSDTVNTLFGDNAIDAIIEEINEVYSNFKPFTKYEE